MYQKQSGLTRFVILFCDIVCIIASLWIADDLWHDGKQHTGVDISFYVYFQLILLGTYLVAFLFSKSFEGFYIRGYLLELWTVIKINIIIVLGTSLVMVFVKISDRYSRMVFGLFAVINCLLMWLMRTLLKRILPYMYKKVVVKHNSIIVGDKDFIRDLLDELVVTKDYTTEVIGVVPTDDDTDDFGDVNRITDVDGLTEYCRTASVDEVVFEVTRANKNRLMPIMDELAGAGIIIKYRNKLPEIKSVGCQSIGKAGGYMVATYATRTVSTGNLIVKRSFDIAAGLFGSLVTILITIFVAPAIKIESKGPVFFAQKRVGKNGRIFTIYKFRSMYQDAEARKAELMAKNELDGLVFKMEDDPRITKVGKFIRKTSLDEFPQFFNVLKGDMSMVGTRPPTLDEFKQYNLDQKGRLSFRPGLTGLWQVSGRNSIKNFDDIVALDKEYIKNWSPLYDLKIILKTVPALFSGK